VGIFADLIHEQNKAGIMVTHDLRMCKYVDKVIQMVDGKIARVITERSAIDTLAGSSQFDSISAPNAEEQLQDQPLIIPSPSVFTPVGVGAD